MRKKIVGIYLVISSALTAYIMGRDLSSFTKHGWDTITITWLVMSPFTLIFYMYYVAKALITGAK